MADPDKLPKTWLLRAGRPVARLIAGRRCEIRLHGSEHVPRTGPVILAGNHIGLADGPLLAAYAPRPVHALTKHELFSGAGGTFLRTAGQIPLDRFHPDPTAIRTCLAALDEGRVIGIFPEGRRGPGDLCRFHRGAAYLALVTGAPVVPVTFLGTREPGGGTNDLPGRGARVDMVFGTPYRLGAVPWPRTREQVGQATLLLRRHMLAALEDALRLTGRELPGPLVPGDEEDDPPTGVSERGTR
jgi:1-acyl-sn-glycerol-3-phosphate acyltransferase